MLTLTAHILSVSEALFLSQFLRSYSKALIINMTQQHGLNF